MERFFEKITRALVENGNIREEEEEVYQYALKSMLILGGNILLSLMKSSPNLCVHSSSSYVSPSMLPLSSGDLIEWSLVCHSTLSYQKFCDRHSNHYDHPEELHQSVE